MITGCGLLELGSKNKSTREPLKDYPELSKKVKGTLEERYDHKFEIDRIAYLNQIDVYVLYCNPVDDKELEFRVKTGGKYGESLWDEYGSFKVGYQIDEYYKPIIKKLFPYKKAFFTNGGTYTNWGRIPTYQEMLEDSENTYAMPHIHIFEDVLEKDKKRFLKGILKLIRLLEQQDLRKSKVIIYIYYEEFFEDIDPNWLMEESDWLSHNIYDAPEGVETDAYEYEKQRHTIYSIDSSDYKQINNIKDIENMVWQDD